VTLVNRPDIHDTLPAVQSGGTCDDWPQCDRPATREARIPRPSDPSDLSCVMAFCEEHAPEGLKNYRQWSRYIETPEARRNGHLWLS